MPILDIEIVLRADEIIIPGLAQDIVDAAGRIFNSEPGHTWVKLRSIARDNYAENETDIPESISPVFVSVLKSNLPNHEDIKLEASQLATEIGRLCERPKENVHILYLPEAKDRIFFGGN